MIIGISGKIGSGKDTATAIIQYLLFIDKLTPDHKLYGYRLNTFIKENDGYEREILSFWKNVKFADSLKNFICDVLGCTREQLEDREFKEAPLGEEWIRYGYADGHFYGGSKGTCMNNAACTKERYEEELSVNWQTAYKHQHTPRSIMQMIGTEVGRFVHHDFWVNALMSKYKASIIGYDIDPTIGRYPIYDQLPNWIVSDVRFENEAKSIKDRNGFIIRLQRQADGILQQIEHLSETSLDTYQFDYVVHNNDSILSLANQIRYILIERGLIKSTTVIWN